MRMALGLLLIWVGCAALWVAFHPFTAASATPWGAVTEVFQAAKGQTAGAGK